VPAETRVPVLMLCGASGVGKSSVAWEIYFTLVSSGHAVAHLDLDQVGHGPPGWTAAYEIKLRNAASVWQNFAGAGATGLVLSGVRASQSGIDACVSAIPGADPTVCVLTVSAAEQRERMLRRAREQFGMGHCGASTSMSEAAFDRTLAAAAQDLADLDPLPGAIHVDTTGRTVPDLARDVLSAGCWPTGQRRLD